MTNDELELARPLVQAEIAVYGLRGSIMALRETFERYPSEIRRLAGDVREELDELDGILQRIYEGVKI